MTFDELLAQIIDLLQRDQRVSYRALKRRFELDDDYLDDLKEEIIYAKQLAMDEDGRVLVWVGERRATPGTSATQTAQPEVFGQAPATQIEPPPPEPPTPDAERRQLTVMFCDLTDSTQLSGQLDPEDLRDVIRAYQTTSAEVIERYDGYIAQHLGDGLMVYFGWPQAHEDDAQRAVYAGLGILGAMGQLNARLEQEKDIRLAVRIGIHTGLVVVGEIGQGASQEHLALGETPNIASRIESIAEPDTVAISDATYQLVQGYFVCDDLGQHTLKGVNEPQHVYQAVKESDAQSRLDVAASRGLTPLVGRESESALLFDRWRQVKDGQGQVVLLSGEAGIGKSRLLQVLRGHVADEPHLRLECRSSPYYQNTALYPITDLLQRTLQFQTDDTSEQRLEKLKQELSQYRLPLEESVPLIAPLLSLPVPEDRYPTMQWSAQRQRQKTLESIVAILLEQAEQQPVLFILEDLHWTDPTTLELLDLLIDQVPTASIYTLLTCRPTFQPTWSHRSYLTEMTVSRLSQREIESMAEQVAGGKHLPDEVLQQITEKTDGVPLFVEEMTKAVLESGHLKEDGGHYESTGSLSSLAIPVTLQDSLMARLDRLMTAKVIAQLGAVIGRQFSYDLLHAVSQLDERTLQRELERLVEAELLYQRGLPPQAIYTFKHALIQDTAYESLLRTTRQQHHAQVATVLESQFPDITESQPELLAQHYTEAGLNEQAIGYWHKAGQNAVQRSAYIEATDHATNGLKVIARLPDTPERLQHELGLQTILCPALMHTKGFAASEVENAFTRARALCEQVEDVPQLFQFLVGLWRFYLNRAEYHTACDLGKQLVRVSELTGDQSSCVAAHSTLGSTHFFMGDLVDARIHLEQGIALYNAQQYHSNALLAGMDSQVSCRSYASLVLWLLGYPKQALCRSLESLHIAQELSNVRTLSESLHLRHELSNAPTLLHALFNAGVFRQLYRDSDTAHEQLKVAMYLASEYGLVLNLARQTITYGWVLAMQGYGEDGITQIRQGLGSVLATGAELGQPQYLSYLAEAYGLTGQVEKGLAALAEGLTLVDKTSERWFEAEIHRLKGELLLQQSPDNQTKAETCFHQALDIARRQQAKSWELRAATSLARLWQSQGKRQKAYDLLQPVHGWFTEGFDTADLKDAKSLLEELG